MDKTMNSTASKDEFDIGARDQSIYPDHKERDRVYYNQSPDK